MLSDRILAPISAERKHRLRADVALMLALVGTDHVSVRRLCDVIEQQLEEYAEPWPNEDADDFAYYKALVARLRQIYKWKRR